MLMLNSLDIYQGYLRYSTHDHIYGSHRTRSYYPNHSRLHL